MKHKRNDAEASLFREAVRDVKPLAPDRRIVAPTRRLRARPSPARQGLAAEDLADLDPRTAGSGEELAFRRPGIQDSVLRKLRRGRYGVQSEIDLHGLTAAQAREALLSFLAEALERRARCVRIVHGKGLRSGTRGPVLRNTTTALLRASSAVAAFVAAPPAEGGTGALYVLLAT